MFIKRVKLALKVVFSVAILYYILQNLNLSSSLKIISEINPIVFALMLILYVLGQYISSVKWGFISQELGFGFTKSDYVSYYFTGMFFNLFLPTSVGGDVIKGYYLCKQDIPNKKNKAFISVFWDRLTGAMMLVLLAFTGVLFVHRTLPLSIDLSVILASIGVLVFVFALPYAQKLTLKENLTVFVKNLSGLNKDTSLWLKMLAYGLSFHFIAVLIHFILAQSLGIYIPVPYLLIVYPITAIASFLPISLNGIGVREGLYVYLLSLAGVSYERAFAFSVLWFLVMTISSLFSVVFYLKSKEEIEL